MEGNDGWRTTKGERRRERDSEPLSGNSPLVFRKLDGRWVIMHDHASRAVE